MKKIVLLPLLLIFLIPFSHAFANDTDLYILTQLMTQVPPDTLILLDLSGSMSNYPTDQPTYTLYIDPRPCNQECQYTCGSNTAYYPASSSSNTSSCSGSGAQYSSSSSTCSTGPLYINSGSGHSHSCSGVPSTLYYNPGTCTNQCTYSCGNTTIPYYYTDPTGGTDPTPCTENSTTVVYGNSTCSGPFYLNNTCGSSACQTVCTQNKVSMAQRALFKLLDADNCTGTGTPDGIINSCDQAYLKIRMGYMRYYGSSEPETVNSTSWEGPPNPSKGNANTVIDPINTPYNVIYCNNATSCTPNGPATAISIETETASGGTPLAAALQEANYYLTYTKTLDNDAACRQKFLILLTDGDDTWACGMNGSEGEKIQYKGRREVVAQARGLANAGYYVFAIGFGSTMPSFEQNTLNWVAYYGNTKNTNATQSITTMYTIPYGAIYPSGVTQCMSSSQVMGPYTSTGAPYWGYTYYYANSPANSDPGQDAISGYAFIAQNESDLNAAINNIRNFIIALIAQSTSYVAPVVPISQYQSTSSENMMYLGMFEPTNTTMWDGNLKKYGIQTTNTATLSVGEVIDENGNLAIAPNSSTIVSTAESYWSTSPDGGNVEAGGAGGVLQALGTNLNSRNIYTYLGTNTDLTTSSNAFSTSNTLITPALLGVSTTTAVQNIINFAYGWDAYNWNNGPGNPRQWILGAIIHSKPAVIHYGNQDVIYVGANDGMLHAFDNATGNELWAFIPPDLLPNLQNFGNSLTSLQIFVDGSPTTYVTSTYNSNGSVNSVTQAILVFGERRGGNTYTALDVTNPSDPKFLWSISPTQIRYQTTTTASTAYQEMGQTWSTPILARIQNGSGTKWVVFIGGGYDATHEDTLPPGTDTCGRAVYVVDILTGNQIWKYSFSNDPNMKYCIPSDITAISVNGNGLIQRLYVGDVGGQMWRFNIGDMGNTGSWTGNRVFTGVGKIFYPPDVTFETNKGQGTYDMLFFGTGDREKPNDTTVTAVNPNRLYAIKDYDNEGNCPVPLPFTESNLVNVTSDVLQSSTATSSAKTSVLQNLQSSMGWYIQLNQSAGENPNPGEKCDASAVVLAGAVYYTTFTPTPVNTQSVCTINTGQGNVYVLQYQTGNAMFTLSNDNTLTVNDRSMTVGAGIPSGIVIAVINGTVTGYGGVAGGVFSPTLNINNSIVPLDWRIVF